MKNFLKNYREKVLATPNLKTASKINFILALLTLFISVYIFPSIIAGKWFAFVVEFFSITFCIDGFVSSYIQRKELKLREKTKK